MTRQSKTEIARVNLSMPQEHLEGIDSVIRHNPRYVSQSGFVREAVQQLLEKLRPPPGPYDAVKYAAWLADIGYVQLREDFEKRQITHPKAEMIPDVTGLPREHPDVELADMFWKMCLKESVSYLKSLKGGKKK